MLKPSNRGFRETSPRVLVAISSSGGSLVQGSSIRTNLARTVLGYEVIKATTQGPLVHCPCEIQW